MLPKIIKLINNTKAIFKIDSKPTKGSTNLITSGGMYKALNSSGNSAVIILKQGWSAETLPTNLENVAISKLPELQLYKGGDINEYLFQLLFLHVIAPTDVARKVEVTTYKLYTTSEPGGGSQFVWAPVVEEGAPFACIIARYGLGSSSWVWAVSDQLVK